MPAGPADAGGRAVRIVSSLQTGLAKAGRFGLTSPRMADKQTPLILEALTRAAAEPGAWPTLASRSEPGLFPNTATGKAAARRCLDERMLQTLPAKANGKAREVCAITDRGLSHLNEQVNPKKLLDDFVRILELRRDQVDGLLETARQMAASLDGLKATVAALLPQVQSARVPVPMNRIAESRPDDLSAAIATHLADWRSDAARDCPLPDLYRAVACGHPDCSVGRFHDELRRLHDLGRIYLHPWTGPLYAVPEPAFALLVGHNVAYYASAR